MNWFHSEKQWVRWSLRLGAMMAILLFIVAWTRGSVEVSDESVDHLVGADLDVWQWPSPGSDGDCDTASNCWTWAWPEDDSAPDYPTEDHHTSTWNDFFCDPWSGICHPLYSHTWGFRDDFNHCPPFPASPQLVDSPHEWYRFRIDKEDYRPTFYYEYHDGYDESCDIYDCDNDDYISHDCHTIDPFDVLPENPQGEHELKPDLMVDLRNLTDLEFDCMKQGGPKVYQVTLRASTGLANVGTGGFEASFYQDQNNETQVKQIVTTTDENTEEYVLPDGMVEFYDSHNEFKLKDWVQFRILDDDSQCKSRPGDRPSWCELKTGHNSSACIYSENAFDEEISDEYDGGQAGGCGHNFELAPGWKTTYLNDLFGQGIQLGTTGNNGTILSEGYYLLEAHWDPEGTWEEYGSFRERNNTSAIIAVYIPSFSTSDLDPSCDWVTDCHDWQQLDDSDPIEGPKKDRCRDHLRCDINNGGCSDNFGGSCVSVPGEEDTYCELP